MVDSEAARLQAGREGGADGDDLGPLHGIPVSIKDHISVEGLPYSTWRANDTSRRPHDIQVGGCAAGAVIVGTNTEMAPACARRASGARSSLGGCAQPGTRSARGLSSSGSATATVSRMVPLALGSDGGG